MENWKDIPGYEGKYQVSDGGQVKSLARTAKNGPGFRRVRERILKCAYLKRKRPCYLVVNLSKGDHQQTYLIHRLVLEAFVGPCPEGMEGCHKDGNPENNQLHNLRWDTPKGNAADNIPNGSRNRIRGENHYNAKKTDTQVRRIRRLFDSGRYSQKQLATKFHLSFVAIHKIVRHKVWTHI